MGPIKPGSSEGVLGLVVTGRLTCRAGGFCRLGRMNAESLGVGTGAEGRGAGGIGTDGPGAVGSVSVGVNTRCGGTD